MARTNRRDGSTYPRAPSQSSGSFGLQLTMTEVSCNLLIESFLATQPLVISTEDEGALRLRRSGETPRTFPSAMPRQGVLTILGGSSSIIHLHLTSQHDSPSTDLHPT